MRLNLHGSVFLPAVARSEIGELRRRDVVLAAGPFPRWCSLEHAAAATTTCYGTHSLTFPFTLVGPKKRHLSTFPSLRCTDEALADCKRRASFAHLFIFLSIATSKRRQVREAKAKEWLGSSSREYVCAEARSDNEPKGLELGFAHWHIIYQLSNSQIFKPQIYLFSKHCVNINRHTRVCFCIVILVFLS